MGCKQSKTVPKNTSANANNTAPSKHPKDTKKQSKPEKTSESDSLYSGSQSESSRDGSEILTSESPSSTSESAVAKKAKATKSVPTKEPSKKKKTASSEAPRTKDEPKKEVKAKKSTESEAKTVTPTSDIKKDDLKVSNLKESKTDDGKWKITFDLPNEDHKYVVGKGGENIKSIRAETNADVQLDPEKSKSDHVVIIAATPDEANKAKNLVIEAVKKVKDQHNATEEWYQEFQRKVDEHAKKRQEYFDASKKAHDEGNGALAKELSDKAKKEGELMKKAQEEAARAVFKKRNEGNGDNVIDLHGLQVDPAVMIVGEYLDKWVKKSGSYTIITGKGLHSDEKGPKIRPAVEKLLKDRKIKFEDVPGQFEVST